VKLNDCYSSTENFQTDVEMKQEAVLVTADYLVFVEILVVHYIQQILILVVRRPYGLDLILKPVLKLQAHSVDQEVK
jgi:hypothetical protein